jgi:hypothetical protein
MKKLLLATSLILAGLASPALAGNVIPTEFHGEWCSLNGHPYLSPRAEINKYPEDDRDPCGKDSDGWIKITANRYDAWEQRCKPVTVTKVSGEYSYRIKLKCTVEGGETDVFNIEVVTTTGTKGLGKRLYINTPHRE